MFLMQSLHTLALGLVSEVSGPACYFWSDLEKVEDLDTEFPVLTYCYEVLNALTDKISIACHVNVNIQN